MDPATPIEVVFSSLIEALKIEKDRLLAGDYADLPKIAERKAHYMGVLEARLAAPDAAHMLKSHFKTVEFIRTGAQENAKLLASAKAGATAAKARLRRMANRETMVGAYTHEGEKLRTHDFEVTRQKMA